LPEIFAIITGKGPEKEKYVLQIEKLKSEGKLEMVTIKTTWLSLQDYASLLASADLGVSLHTSSSGVDLPMKVVDMFGAGLPVLGWNKFEAWPELVIEGTNGMGFADANEMADKLVYLLSPDNKMLSRLKEGALAEGKRRWDDEWDPIAGRLFELVH
jgi:beta-1,4-mannosyltransferase